MAVELRIKTTHDGSQAEASMKRLERSVDRLANGINGKLKSAIIGAFSVEKIIQFGRAIDRTLEKMNDLVDKVKEGKKGIESLDKSEGGPGRGNAGFASEYSKFKGELKGPWESAATGIARGFIASAGSSIGGIALRRMFSPAEKLYQSATADDATRAASLNADVSSAIDKRNAESDRQIAIREIQEAEGSNATDKAASLNELRKKMADLNSKKVESPTNISPQYSNFQSVGAYSMAADAVMNIQRQQVARLTEIRNLLKQQKEATQKRIDAVEAWPD